MRQLQFSKHHYGIWVPVGILLIVAVVALLFTLSGMKQPVLSGRIARAQELYRQKKAAGVSMDSGPCLGVLENDWVVDIAHNPRTSVDNLAENQCADYRNGTVHHFLELTPEGQYIRSQ